MTDADRWEYRDFDFNKSPLNTSGWEWVDHLICGVARYRRLRYPRYAELADIPITPGRVEWSGTGNATKFARIWMSDCTGLRVQMWRERLIHDPLNAQIEFICDLFAPVVESDEAWLRKRGDIHVDTTTRSHLWVATFMSHTDRGPQVTLWTATHLDGIAALRRAVEAIEGGGE